MNINHLKYFFDAYKTGSVYKASQINTVAISTVSQAISSLENHLGYLLTKKTKGTLNLTDKGLKFAKDIEPFIEQFELLFSPNNKVEEKDVQGTINLCTHQSLLTSFLWKILRDFNKKYPLVELNITTAAGSALGDLLESEKISLAISLEDIHGRIKRSFYSKSIRAGHFKLFANNKFKLDKNAPCIVTNKYMPEVNFLINNSPWLKIDSYFPSWSTIQHIINNEPVFGYLPEYILENNYNQKLYEPKFAKELRYPYDVKLWYTHKSKLNIATALLIESLVKY